MLKPEVAQISRTRVSDTLGKIWGSTTPKGKNWAFEWFMRGLSDEKRHEAWASFAWKSCDNPYFPKSEWEDAKRDLPEDFFLQEYCGKFLDDVSAVFKGVADITRDVDEAVTTKSPFFLGLDLARIRDYTVMHVMGADGQSVDWKRFRGMDWADQKTEILQMAEHWEDAVVVMDATGGQGDIFYEELTKALGKRKVIGVKFTMESKRQMIQSLQTAIERGEITIQRHEALLDELKWFQYSLTKGGRIHYGAPKGYHDDSVWGLALANHGRVRGSSGTKAALVRVEPLLTTQRSISGAGMMSSGNSLRSRNAMARSSGRMRHFLGGA
ncbi:MAG: hypothetical protein IH969_09770 [Candidatus Krumholzibacteriota bacterium]|nr:hypothetical protein [Candidatus Krumholzibacteriota bacterium]